MPIAEVRTAVYSFNKISKNTYKSLGFLQLNANEASLFYRNVPSQKCFNIKLLVETYQLGQFSDALWSMQSCVPQFFHSKYDKKYTFQLNFEALLPIITTASQFNYASRYSFLKNLLLFVKMSNSTRKI